MTTAQVVETSVTVKNNSPIQDYVHPEDQTQPTLFISPEISETWLEYEIYILKYFDMLNKIGE